MLTASFRRTMLLGLGMLGAGCVSVGPGGGRDGPVQWEIVDVGRVDSIDGHRSRWSYTIVLRERAGSSIQFERIEHGMDHPMGVMGGTGRIDFVQRLEANGELRYHATDDWGWSASTSPQFGGTARLSTATRERQFVGRDAQGHTVVVRVRVALDRSLGRPSRQPLTVAPSPPPVRSLQPQDLRALAGTWVGYYHSSQFHVPITAILGADGSVEFGENDPVTNRFQRALRVRDGRAFAETANDAVELSYREGDGRHVLEGQLAYGTGRATRVPIWLERVGRGTASGSESPPRRVGLPQAVRTAFDVYTTDPKYTHFKAFAADRASGAWGRAWGLPSAASAMERALYECGKRGTGCEVYAVGDTVLETASPAQRAVIVLGGAQLTFRGTLTTEQAGRVESSKASFYVFRGRTEVTGSWSTDDRQTSGVITDSTADTNQPAVNLTQSDPCRATFAGVLAIGEDGKSLDASYAGPGCDGAPLKATFTGVRQ